MTLADADAVTIAAIKAALPDATVGTQAPYKLTESLPFAVARRFGGAAVDPRFLDRATVDVDTWGGTREAAYDMAASIRQALFDSARNQTVYDDLGYIARFREVSAPAELRTDDQPEKIWRFQATYSLFVRPAPN